MTTGIDGMMAPSPTGDPAAAWGAGGTRDWWLALGAAGAMLALTYAPNLVELSSVWSEDENYTHGFLVIPIALFILWRRMVDIPWTEPRARRRVGVVGLGPALRGPGGAGDGLRVELPVVGDGHAGAGDRLPGLGLRGRELLYRAWPAILFLVFMLPLPLQINGMVTLPLQRLAATGSYVLLQISGFWVVQQGNVLLLTTPFGPRPLDVATACSGLKMLMTLAATVTATVMLIPMPVWKRVVVLISAVPIALVSNLVRIMVTGCCYYYIEGQKGMHWAHDISGWMMMPLALLLVMLELALLSWVAPEQTEADRDDDRVVLPLLGAPGRSRATADGAHCLEASGRPRGEPRRRRGGRDG